VTGITLSAGQLLAGSEAKLHFAQRVLVLFFCFKHLTPNFVFPKMRLLPPIEFSYRMMDRSECFFVLNSGYPFLDCYFIRALQLIEIRISHAKLLNLDYRMARLEPYAVRRDDNAAKHVHAADFLGGSFLDGGGWLI